MKTKVVVLLGAEGSGNGEIAKKLSKVASLPVYADIQTEEELLEVVDTYGDDYVAIFCVSKEGVYPKTSQAFMMSGEFLVILNNKDSETTANTIKGLLD
jgi:glycerate-2-kinase